MLLKYVVASALVVGACTSGDPSTTKHTTDQPVQGPQSFQWANIALSQLTDLQSKTLPLDHPASIRLQTWTTKIDEHLRKRHPTELANVPKPQTVIVPSNELNAYVDAVDVCIDLEVVTSDAVPEDIERMQDVVTFRRSDKSLYASSAEGCKEVAVEDRQALIDWLFAGKPECAPTLTDDRLTVDAACREEFSNFRAAKKLAWPATSPYIVFFSQLLKSFKEEEVAAVVAHELGHYYRSHNNVLLSDYNFFYTIPETHIDHRPIAEPALKDYGEAILAQAFSVSEEQWYARVDGAVFHPFFFSSADAIATNFGEQLCQRHEGCHQACQDLQIMFHDDFANFGSYPWEPLPADKRGNFDRYESLLGECLAALPADDAGRQSLNSIIEGNDRDLWLHVVQPAASFGTLGDYVRALSDAVVVAAETRFDAFAARLEDARDRRVGFYTWEQEADEYSLEWLDAIGLDPDAAVRSQINLLTQTEGISGYRPAPTSIPGSDCQQLHANDWMIGKGQQVFVPLADFSGLHHSGCFRAFNMARESKAHAYKTFQSGAAQGVDQESWATLTASLSTEPLDDGRGDNTILRPRMEICDLFAVKTRP